MITDGHNHTCHYSPDAEMTIDQLITSAVNNNIPRIGITEHYELDNPDKSDIIQTFDIDSYSRDFEKWKSMCPDSLTLLKGIEFGYQTHTASAIDEICKNNDFDTIILSNHLFRGVDLYFSKDAYKVPKKDRHKEYIGIMAEMCEKIDNFTVAGHYDYINRYTPEIESYVEYDDCPNEFDRFFEALITKEKALEINTRSVFKLKEKGASQIFPQEKLLKRYMAMGGKLISLGSDSHTCDNLGVMFNETADYLKYLGFKEAFYFIKKRPYTEPL